MSSFAKTALVVGLGKTGLACALYLARTGYHVGVTDTREQPPELARINELLPEVTLFLGGFAVEALARADIVIVSPGVSAQDPFVLRARALGLPVAGDVDLFARHVKAPVVGITGTNGKSTVTTLLGEMCTRAGRDVRVGGNLGTPALDLLHENEPDCYVIELSSFQLDLTDYLPLAAATVLNVTPDHMDRYRNFDEYVAAKERVYYQAAVSVTNRDDPRVVKMAERKRKIISFGLSAPPENHYGLLVRGGAQWLARGNEPLLPVADLNICGEHNQANALAALALGEAMGLPREPMLDVLRDFRGLEHRLCLVVEAARVRWYDDSKATNVGAAIAAISGASVPLVVIAGGDGKGQNFTEFAQALVEQARAVILMGHDADKIAAVLEDLVPYEFASDMDDAVRRAAGRAQAGDWVLLAPACASFDMYDNYEARGDAFIDAVKRWAS